MGLDTTHDAWHGAYSAFTRWRTHIAEKAGYDVVGVPGQGEAWDNRFHYPVIFVDWGHITMQQIMGEWEKTPDDPLLVLITHSDCDGLIRPAQAAPLADRLEEILPLLDGDGGGHKGLYRDKTQKFIDGLRLAVALDEPVEFQ